MVHLLNLIKPGDLSLHMLRVWCLPLSQSDYFICMPVNTLRFINPLAMGLECYLFIYLFLLFFIISAMWMYV